MTTGVTLGGLKLQCIAISAAFSSCVLLRRQWENGVDVVTLELQLFAWPDYTATISLASSYPALHTRGSNSSSLMK